MQYSESKLKKILTEYRAPILLSFILTLLSYLLQVYACESILCYTESTWGRMLDYHLFEYPFSTRLFTDSLLVFMHETLSIALHTSFSIIQFTLTFFLGPALYFLLRGLKLRIHHALLGIVLLYLAFPILGAHIAPVYTWDDFWLYLLLTLSIAGVVRKRTILTAITATIMLFTRENAVLLYPLIIVAAWCFHGWAYVRREWIFFLLPITAYVPYFITAHMLSDMPSINHLEYNFKNHLRASESIYSLYISFGFMWFAAVGAFSKLIRKQRTATENFFFWGSIYIIPVVVLSVLAFGRAREVRLFFPIFVTIIPLATVYLVRCYVWLAALRKKYSLKLLTAVFAGLTIIFYAFSTVMYNSIQYQIFWRHPCQAFTRYWFTISLTVLLLLLTASEIKRLTPQVKNQ